MSYRSDVREDMWLSGDPKSSFLEVLYTRYGTTHDGRRKEHINNRSELTY
jgi:hypothetical protein